MFEERLADEVERARRFPGQALALVMLDIDDFKAVNDRLGHVAGDEVLRAVAATMREDRREMDLAARYGGEELALILPGTDIEGAARAAERIRAAVERMDFKLTDTSGEPLRLTMVFPSWNQTPEVAQLIQSEWRDIGIEVELIRVPDFPTLRSYALEGDFNLIAFYDFGVEASMLNRFYATDGANNWSGFSDPELDGWLHEAVRQVDADTRAALYSSVQQRLMEQAVVLPIRDYVNLNGTTAKLEGVIFSAQGWWPLLRNLQLRP